MANGEPLLDAPRAIRIAAGGQNEAAAREQLTTVRDETTETPVGLVGSTGAIGLEPLLFASRENQTAIVTSCTTETAREIVTVLESDTDLSEDTSTTIDTVLEHDVSEPARPFPEDGPLSVGDQRVLSTAGWLDPTSVAEYERTGTPLSQNSDSLLEKFTDIPLRGRGRGDGSTDEPIHATWETVRARTNEADRADEDPIVVVNANEADPNASMDRLLLESTPLAVIDGALAAAQTVGASEIVIYTNERETLALERAREAAETLVSELDRDPPPISFHAGPDTYMAGEMTAVLESIEGNHRLEARLRPPGPSEHGIDGRPTLIHTPRTLAQLAALFRGDTERVGATSDPGTRLLCVTGDITPAPVTLELPTDADLSVIREAVRTEGRFKAACVGDVFGGITHTLEIPASASGLSSARLGTNGVVELFNHDRCIVEIAGERARFASTENCGRCVTCREGSKQLTELLRGVYDGGYDRDGLAELGRVMRETSICEFGQEAPRPAMTAMDAFEPEFKAHAEGRCPTGTCD